MPLDDTDVESPCVNVCKLDEQRRCIGCLRTVDEIKAWKGMSPQAKRALLQELEGRKMTPPQTGPGEGLVL